MSLSEPVAVIGRYALHDEIASGGMATVHLGRLLGPVGFARTVAIKRLHQPYAKDPEFVSMFLDEARLAARIRHPNVVPTLDVVALSGELFLVMEYVHGVSLARLVKAVADGRTRMPVEVVASVMVGALHGLHAAHQARSERGLPLGIVHRDVSPQNIIVGSDGLARVLDFGVAKASWRIQTTRDGQVKGKLAYMAPEQVHGDEIGPWTDVYAAGIVLWEALANQRLFNGDSAALLARFTKEAPVPAPSTRRPGLPPGLDAVVLKALAPRSDARFASAQEMADAIEACTTLASSSAVARWVQGIAHEELAKYSALIGVIEHGSAPSGQPASSEPSLGQMLASASEGDAPPRARSRPNADGVATETARVNPEAGEQTSNSAVSMTRTPGTEAPPAYKRRGLQLALVAGALLAGALLVLLARSRVPAPGVDSEPRATASLAQPAAASAEPERPPPPAVVNAEPSAAPSAKPPPEIAKPAPSRASGRPALAAAPRIAPSCNPPYIVDARGIRHMKLACLQ